MTFSKVSRCGSADAINQAIDERRRAVHCGTRSGITSMDHPVGNGARITTEVLDIYGEGAVAPKFAPEDDHHSQGD